MRHGERSGQCRKASVAQDVVLSVWHVVQGFGTLYLSVIVGLGLLGAIRPMTNGATNQKAFARCLQWNLAIGSESKRLIATATGFRAFSQHETLWYVLSGDLCESLPCTAFDARSKRSC